MLNEVRSRSMVGRRLVWSWACGLSLMAVVGCGGSETSLPSATTYEVKGQVLLPDGTPLPGGRILFVPQGDSALVAQGAVAQDGSFTLTTLKPGDGAVPGTYRVRIEPPAEVAVTEKAGKSKSKKPTIHVKYTDEDSSGLKVAVRPESNQLEPIRLK
jgi:hypothetical protein